MRFTIYDLRLHLAIWGFDSTHYHLHLLHFLLISRRRGRTPLATACAAHFVRGICRYYPLPSTNYHLPTTITLDHLRICRGGRDAIHRVRDHIHRQRSRQARPSRATVATSATLPRNGRDKRDPPAQCATTRASSLRNLQMAKCNRKSKNRKS